MSVLVVDASVAAKWFFEEQYADAAQEILDVNYQLHVPDFFRLEMDSIIAKRLRRGESNSTKASAFGMHSVCFHFNTIPQHALQTQPLNLPTKPTAASTIAFILHWLWC